MVNKSYKFPREVVLQLTEVCNLRCKMCYEWGETGCYINPEFQRKPATLKLELVNRIINELAPAKPMYSLFGGEPFMYPHLEEVICAIKKAGSTLDAPTNGTLLKKNANMLVQTGFDSIRVSIDGPQNVNDLIRGKGSYEKVMAGIEALYAEKQTIGTNKPLISIIYTVTPENHLSIEKFFLRDLNLATIDWVTIQMENFLTDKMGESYAQILRSKFEITSDRFWRGLVRSPEDFNKINTIELSRQVNNIYRHMKALGKSVLLLPPTFSPENLNAYIQAKWKKMVDIYHSCPIPWNCVDITASGDVAPCHVFYDLVMGNLYKQSFNDIWNGEMYRSFRAYMTEHNLMSICPGCCILYLSGKKRKKTLNKQT